MTNGNHYRNLNTFVPDALHFCYHYLKVCGFHAHTKCVEPTGITCVGVAKRSQETLNAVSASKCDYHY